MSEFPWAGVSAAVLLAALWLWAEIRDWRRGGK